jgi:DMSO reductase anchor subunit
VTLRHEWTLVAFTFLAALLVAWVGGAAAGAPRPSWAVFAAGALGAMGVSAAHLGRRDRAWRALLNLRRSWLSREIAAFLRFAGAATAWLAMPQPSPAAGWLAAALGLLTLVCADRVYGLALRPVHARPHSAEVALIGVSLAALIAGSGWIALGVGLARLALYARRKLGRARAGEDTWPAVSLARAIAGFALPLAAWLLGAHGLAIAGAVAGDLIDRCEFYAELEFESPQRRMDLSLAAASPGRAGSG